MLELPGALADRLDMMALVLLWVIYLIIRHLVAPMIKAKRRPDRSPPYQIRKTWEPRDEAMDALRRVELKLERLLALQERE